MHFRGPGHGPHHGHGPGHGHGPFGPGWGESEGRRAAFGPFGPPFDGPAFGGPPFGGRGRRGHHGRARRGDVRASILALLRDRPMHGYEMIQQIAERSEGAWRPSPGSVYPTLQLLEDEGLIRSETEGGKKLLSLTEAGRVEAESTPSAPWSAVGRDVDWESVREVQQAGFALLEAFAQVWKTGNAQQQKKALNLINESRKRLYLILAEQGDDLDAEDDDAGDED